LGDFGDFEESGFHGGCGAVAIAALV
jgi:hypothetical protein